MLHSEIGEGTSALYCLTDREFCCSTEAGANHGSWNFPNGSTVNVDITKGFSSILLNRRSSAVKPTGVYRCVIPDARNITRTLHIGIYDANISNEGGLKLIWAGCYSKHPCTLIFYRCSHYLEHCWHCHHCGIQLVAEW